MLSRTGKQEKLQTKLLKFSNSIQLHSILHLHFYHHSLGPTFGAGPDLSIAGDCNVNSESCSRLSHSYGGDHRSPASLMGAREFKVADYEVFVPKTS